MIVLRRIPVTPRWGLSALGPSRSIGSFLCFIMTQTWRTVYMLLLLYTKLKAGFSRCEDVVKHRNTRDQLAWTGYLAHRNSKGEARGRSKHQNNSKRVV